MFEKNEYKTLWHQVVKKIFETRNMVFVVLEDNTSSTFPMASIVEHNGFYSIYIRKAISIKF